MRAYQTATDFAVFQMKAMIVSRELEPGMRIDQTEMAERLGLSRNPIRQALFQLAERNFVILQAHKSAVVAPISAKDVRDLYSTRSHLEPWALTLSMPNYSADVVERLSRLAQGTDDAAQAGDIETFMKINRDFHLLLVEPADNAHLYRVIENLYDLSERYQMAYLSAHLGMDVSASDHHKVIEAIKSNNEEKLVEISTGHNNKTMQWVLNQYKDNGVIP